MNVYLCSHTIRLHKFVVEFFFNLLFFRFFRSQGRPLLVWFLERVAVINSEDRVHRAVNSVFRESVAVYFVWLFLRAGQISIGCWYTDQLGAFDEHTSRNFTRQQHLDDAMFGSNVYVSEQCSCAK